MSVSFNLNGELPSSDVGIVSGEWSRLRMFATGQMAPFVYGELAIVEPDADSRWLTRSTKGNALFPLALTIPIEVELRGGGERVGRVITLGNGAPVRSPLLVLQSPDDDSHIEPQTLRIVGFGSGGYMAEPLYLLAPQTWSVTLDSPVGAAEPQLLAEDGRRLWKVSGTVTVLTDEGDAYLIRSGQERDEKDRLILTGKRLPMAEGIDGEEVFLGTPRFFLKEDRRERSSRQGDIWWRPGGTRTWRSADAVQPLGVCEFVWRNPTTGHIRDRATVVVLPSEFTVGLPGQSGAMQLSLAGWPGQCIYRGQPGDGAGHAWSIGDGESMPTEAQVVLRSESAPPFQLRLRLPRRPGIGTWDGNAAGNHKVLALAELHNYLAVAQGRRSMTARLRDGEKRYVKQGERRWTFEDELPLTAIHDDLAAMLRPLGDIDATVELAIEGSSTIWFVNEFGARLRALPDRLVPSVAVSGDKVRVVARPLHQSVIEQDLGPVQTGSDWSGISRDVLPSEGTWLIYLRSADNVLTRPYLHVGRPLGDPPRTRLSALMVEGDHALRQVAVEKLCDHMETGSMSDPSFDELLSLIENLHGLPPATFDIVSAAFRRPRLAVRMLFRASSKQCPQVLALEDGLPFSWSCIPKTTWDQVAEDHFLTILALLPVREASSVPLAAGAVSSIRRAISGREPELAPLLGLGPQPSRLGDIAQSFVQRAHDRALGFGDSPFRQDMSKMLPDWPFIPEFFRALDAPCAAALAAKGLVRLSDLQMRCVKDIARRHPRYFLEAYAACFKDQSVA